MIVRQATPKDIPDILDMYKKGLIDLGLDDFKESLMLSKIVASYHLAPCFLVEINDKICAMAGLTVNTISHSGVASLADYMFYVEPEHRNLKVLNSLVREIKKFAEDNDMPLRLDLTFKADLKVKERLLEMNGLEPYALVGVYNG